MTVILPIYEMVACNGKGSFEVCRGDNTSDYEIGKIYKIGDVKYQFRKFDTLNDWLKIL